MTNNCSTKDQATRWIHWIARGTGSLLAAFWLLTGVLSGIIEPGPWSLESVIMGGLIITSALGVLVAWWREGIGGTMVVVCAVAHSVFAYVASGHNRGLAMLISGGPFLVVGVLFLASWWRARGARMPESDA